MDPQLRKTQTEELLKKEGIPFAPSLPCVESESETTLRSPEEVGIRIACLYCVVGRAFEADGVFSEHLRRHDLWGHLSPEEALFLSSETPDPKDAMNFTWRSEAMFLLMWATQLFDSLPIPRQETETEGIVSRLPALSVSPWPFIRRLQLRKKEEILNASDLIYRLHWATEQARLDGMPAPARLNPSVLQEWHHAINWITRYCDQEWDDVSTDT
jgi:hypothetical protein